MEVKKAVVPASSLGHVPVVQGPQLVLLLMAARLMLPSPTTVRGDVRVVSISVNRVKLRHFGHF